MFERILVANRGEIAVRVIRTCREMGIRSVAVYSDADARSPHVAAADRAVRIGPPPALESYLSIARILAAARETGATAIHPGYGFLSENARFAQACEAAGLTFIGPPPAALAAMGSKVRARQIAEAAGVPLVPGDASPDQSDAALARAALRIGLPVLVKATEGGGGIGMRAVHRDDDLPGAVAQARRAAEAAFGDGTLYVERLIERPRHVEVQVAADAHGGVVHLFERECSIQRRHQKLVEEAPCTALTPALRERMGAAAVAIAKRAGYQGLGTVEFLLDGSGDEARFYFLEVNARLQVEHPITEAVTGLDLVRAQIAIAAGNRLPWAQRDLSLRGHAIEARLYAEDPVGNDLPQAGPLLMFRPPSMPGVRVDAGVEEGGQVTVHYDPLLAKVIASGESRESARRRLVAALREFPVLGVLTNAALLVEVLEHPRFVDGDTDTAMLESIRPGLLPSLTAPPPPEVETVAKAARADRAATPEHPGGPQRSDLDPWSRPVGPA
jgi:acetyl/propionyl-CoA carboxylase alpha subunit